MAKTDKSTRIPNKSGVTRNVAGNALPPMGGVGRQSVNRDIPDPSGLDDTKAMAGRMTANQMRNAKERSLPPPRPGKMGTLGALSEARRLDMPLLAAYMQSQGWTVENIELTRFRILRTTGSITTPYPVTRPAMEACQFDPYPGPIKNDLRNGVQAQGFCT